MGFKYLLAPRCLRWRVISTTPLRCRTILNPASLRPYRMIRKPRRRQRAREGGGRLNSLRIAAEAAIPPVTALLHSSTNERLCLSSAITSWSCDKTSRETEDLANEAKSDLNRTSSEEVLLPKTAHEATRDLEARCLSSAVYYCYYFHCVTFARDAAGPSRAISPAFPFDSHPTWCLFLRFQLDSRNRRRIPAFGPVAQELPHY